MRHSSQRAVSRAVLETVTEKEQTMKTSSLAKEQETTVISRFKTPSDMAKHILELEEQMGSMIGKVKELEVIHEHYLSQHEVDQAKLLAMEVKLQRRDQFIKELVAKELK